MKLRKGHPAKELSLLVGLSVLPVAALAGDGWYVGGSIGANLLKDQDWKVNYLNNTATRRDGQFAAVDFEEGWIGALRGGYAFSNGLRIDVDLQRRRNELSTIDLAPVGLFDQGGPAGSPQGAMITDTLFANVWYDLFKSKRWHPYIGGGMGMALLKVKDAGYEGGSYHDETDEVTGFQLGAGIGFDLRPKVTLSLDYRYLKLDDASYSLLGSSQPSSIKLQYEADSISFSLRYSFGDNAGETMPEMAPETEPVAVVEPLTESEMSAEPTPIEETAPAASATAGCEAPGPGDQVNLEGCKSGDSVVLRGVTFEYNRATLTVDSKTILDQVSDELKALGPTQIEISGHTDSKGADKYNQSLSEARANSVKTYFAEQGLDPASMTAEGFGETQPVADNETEAGRQLNRRVELKIVGHTTSAPVEAASVAEESIDGPSPEPESSTAATTPGESAVDSDEIPTTAE